MVHATQWNTYSPAKAKEAAPCK